MSVAKKLALIAFGYTPPKVFADKSPEPGVSLLRVLRGLSLMDIAERFFVAAAATSLLLIVATAWLEFS